MARAWRPGRVAIRVIVLQNSKIGRYQKSRESRILGGSGAAIYSVPPIRSSVFVFPRTDVVPHVSSHETDQRS